VTAYLRFIATLEVIAYVIYLFLLIFGQFDLPGILALISFLLVTFSFITTEVILGSIIEVREAVFGRGEGIPEALRTKPNPYLEGETTSKGTTNILEKGGTLIEQNTQTKKWVCSCGFHNSTSSYECLSCTKHRPLMNR
jgi:hypothetical protein